jgi:hypothetical protein
MDITSYYGQAFAKVTIIQGVLTLLTRSFSNGSYDVPFVPGYVGDDIDVYVEWSARSTYDYSSEVIGSGSITTISTP